MQLRIKAILLQIHKICGLLLSLARMETSGAMKRAWPYYAGTLLVVVYTQVTPVISVPTSWSDHVAASQHASQTVSKPNSPVDLDWSLLGTLDFRTYDIPAQLKKLNGALVRIPGFVVPLDDEAEFVSEFLLVPYFGACIHVPPPPPNQIVHVKMAPGKKTGFDFWRPLLVQGQLTIARVESPYGEVSYQLTGLHTEPYMDPYQAEDDSYYEEAYDSQRE